MGLIVNNLYSLKFTTDCPAQKPFIYNAVLHIFVEFDNCILHGEKTLLWAVQIDASQEGSLSPKKNFVVSYRSGLDQYDVG